MRKTTRYFATPEEAVPLARSRAKQEIKAKYIAQSEHGYYVGHKPEHAVLKVTYSGDVIALDKALLPSEQENTLCN